MRVYKEDSFVLRTVPFTETSLIVDVFSRNYGRRNLLAKGARNLKSKIRSALQPFQLISLNWSGKGEVPVITDATVSQVSQVVPSGEAFYAANHLNELVVQYLHTHDSHPALFDAYLLAIGAVVNTSQLTQTLRVFEMKLLAELGYALNLETENDRQTPIRSNTYYIYDFSNGPIPVDVIDESTVSGRTLIALAEERIETREAKAESRRLLERAFHWHFQKRTDCSREVFRQTREPLVIDFKKATSSDGL